MQRFKERNHRKILENDLSRILCNEIQVADEYFTLFIARITWQAIKDNVKTNKNNKRNISISRPMPNFVKVSNLINYQKT